MVVTNLVVALMIVSNGLERVCAVQVNPEDAQKTPAYLLVDNPHYFETMYRERTYTNFVYSTSINMGKLIGKCPRCENENIHYDAGDFYGKEIYSIFFYGLPAYLCDECDYKTRTSQILDILNPLLRN